MARALGVVASVFAWLGWLTLAPAFGFPTMGTAAMVNRVLAPSEDPGFWLGWALLLVGLVVAALVYHAVADRGHIRPGVVTGVAYGAVVWLVVGAVVMPLLGLALPAPPPAPPGALVPPDPMRGTFMMLHLGVGAPLAGLVAWLTFGAVVGSTSGSRAGDPTAPRPVARWDGRPDEPVAAPLAAVASFVALVALVGAGWVVGHLVMPWPATPAGAERYSEPVEGLPEGATFVSIIELPQAAGGTLGLHAHVPGYAWSLRGVETLNFHDGRTLPVGPGEAGFMGADAVHSHVNADGRLPAAALAIAILVLAALTCVAAWRPAWGGGRLITATLVVLMVAGMVGTWNPWTNDWLFISIRPEAARGGAMPLPSASRVYGSPALEQLPPGPYVETVDEVTLPPNGEAVEIGSVGASMLLALDGRIEVQTESGSTLALGSREATLVQPGSTVVVSNAEDRPARVLTFTIEPAAS